LNLSCDKFEEVFLKTSHLAQEGENLFHHNRDLMINLKDSFVSYLKSREKMNTDFTHQLNSTQELTQLMTYEEKRKQEMMQIMMEFFHHLPQLHSWREEMKSLRQDAYENRQRLGHGLSQMIHFKKKIKDAQLLEKFEEQYGKVNEDLSRQNHSYDLLEKKLQTMEVIFTKTQLIFSTLENKLEQIFQDFNQRSRDQNQKFDFKEYILRTDLMNKELVLQEDNLAELIKGIYQFNETEGQIFQSINHENEIIVSSFEETNSNDQLELKDSLQ